MKRVGIVVGIVALLGLGGSLNEAVRALPAMASYLPNVNVNQVGGTAVSSPLPVTSQASTSGGSTNYHVIAAASDNHATIKNGAGKVYTVGVTALSTGQYVRLYNAGSGFNGCNSATNLVWGQNVPNSNAGFIKTFPVGLQFSTGIAICITGGGAAPSDTDTTNAATTTVVNVSYD